MQKTIKALKFTPEFEQAILDKKKSETRILMDPQPVKELGGYFWPSNKAYEIAWAADDSALAERIDGYKPGVTFEPVDEWTFCPYGSIGRWFPVGNSTQQITGIRMERIQDITEQGISAEGVPCSISVGVGEHCGLNVPCQSHRAVFKELWESLYPGSWDRNDWVWVIQFCEVA